MSRTARRRVFVLTFPADLWPLAGWKSVPPKCVLALKAKLHLFIFVPAASVNLKRTSLSFVGVNLGFCENQNVCWVIWCLDRIGRSECWRVCGKFVQQLHKHRHSNSNQIGFINTHTQKRHWEMFGPFVSGHAGASSAGLKNKSTSRQGPRISFKMWQTWWIGHHLTAALRFDSWL